MKKKCLVIGFSSLVCSVSLAAAPVEEAHEYIPAAQQPVVNTAPQAKESGFSLANLPAARWKDSADQEDAKPVRLALNDELGPARDSTTISMSSEQRLLYLSRQMNNLTKMNLPQEMNNLQQQVAQLKGQLQDQGRMIKTLQTQQENFYQNINAKIKQLQNQITTPSGGDNKSTSTTVPLTTTSAAKPVVKVSDMNAYQAAFSQLMNKQYASAQQGFNRYLQDYPQGKYSGNVNYWLGEIALIQKRYPQAEAAFLQVVNHYQGSGKVADARYKLAITHLKMGQAAKAKGELQLIEKQNAGKTVARLAKLQLQQMS